MPTILCTAFISFMHCALTPSSLPVLIGCQGINEFLCLSSECCLSVSGKPYGVGLVTESEDICRLGAYVCTAGLKKPTTCCAGAGQTFCVKQAQSLPFDDDFVKEPICACCFVKVLPVNDAGILKEAPSCNKIGR